MGYMNAAASAANSATHRVGVLATATGPAQRRGQTMIEIAGGIIIAGIVLVLLAGWVESRYD
jgi:hypothetical protein